MAVSREYHVPKGYPAPTGPPWVTEPTRDVLFRMVRDSTTPIPILDLWNRSNGDMYVWNKISKRVGALIRGGWLEYDDPDGWLIERNLVLGKNFRR